MKKSPFKKKIHVPGFSFSGISAGIKESGMKDLALIFSEKTANMAGVFTTNRIKAAPVKLDIKQLKSQKKGQAIIINSGNANACTGDRGIRDAEEMAGKAASELGINPNLVYVSSTGIIGRPLQMSRIRKAIPKAVRELSPFSIEDTASAIMTTDTLHKIVLKKMKVGKKTGTIAGIAKGAGMISPDMATMLSFIMTDIAVTSAALDSALRTSVNKSFNILSVDNDMSTNDTVMIMSNGILENRPISGRSSLYSKFKALLGEVTYELARMIAADGEGSTKLIEISVKGAGSGTDAESVANSIASSTLVKTAMYGKDPNWGRIISAIGYSGAKVDEKRIDIYLNGIKVAAKGSGLKKEKAAKKRLSGKEINITVDLGIGKGNANALTCDLTEDYIKLNAHYKT